MEQSPSVVTWTWIPSGTKYLRSVEQ
jgi:hypothetical protein